MNTTTEKLNQIEEERWSALSLQETLNVEEAIADGAEPFFMTETADMPMNPAAAPEIAGDFDKYQFFNQDQIAGMDSDDLTDFDPDNRGGVVNTGTSELNEDINTLEVTNKSFSDALDPNNDFAENDLPKIGDLEAEVIKPTTSETGTKDATNGQETPVNETRVIGTESFMSMLMSESQDNADMGNNDLTGNDDDTGEDIEGEGDASVLGPDFDEAAFLASLD
jgi:hypothetical protein